MPLAGGVDRHVGGVGGILNFVGLLALFRNLIPREWWQLISTYTSHFSTFFSVYAYARVNELQGGLSNEIYGEAELYVTELVRARPPPSLELSRVKNAAAPSFALVNGEKVVDTFEGVEFEWSHHTKEREQQDPGAYFFRGSQRGSSEEKRWYVLRFHKRHRGALLSKYLRHVSDKAVELRHNRQDRMIYTNYRQEQGFGSRGQPWNGIPFKHPSTFDTLAMNPELKKRVMDDLTTFMSAGAFYRRVGRAWKRGYLLYGPPGTGKSSLIAAMANFTSYDVYDLELTSVSNNSELRKLLMAVPSRSIIVIEDIDCSVELKKRGKPAREDQEQKRRGPPGQNKDENKKEEELTLSGLLNFTDGLWSCCGEQRIVIFTTNFVELLDPALLRSGRMDFHIHMSFCCFEAFKILAFTHLGTKDHKLFDNIEEYLPPKASEIQVTPADIAETLVRNRGEGPDMALQWLLQELKDPNSELRQKKVEKPVVTEDEASKGKTVEAEDVTQRGSGGESLL